MKIVDDVAFGIMEYTSSWKKKEKLKVWGKTYSIIITASDLDEEGINEEQRQKYVEYKERFADTLNENIAVIMNYCKEAYDLQDSLAVNIIDNIIPTNIIFQENGSWGILMDSNYDKENGLVLYFEKGKAYIGQQDEFL